MSTKNWVWKFFHTKGNDAKFAKCMGCGKEYSNGNVARMKKHLRNCINFSPEHRKAIEVQFRHEDIGAKSATPKTPPRTLTSPAIFKSSQNLIATSSSIPIPESPRTSQSNVKRFCDTMDRSSKFQADVLFSRVSNFKNTNFF